MRNRIKLLKQIKNMNNKYIIPNKIKQDIRRTNNILCNFKYKQFDTVDKVNNNSYLDKKQHIKKYDYLTKEDCIKIISKQKSLTRKINSILTLILILEIYYYDELVDMMMSK